MSETASLASASAVAFNKRASTELGWAGKIWPQAVEEYPGLGGDPWSVKDGQAAAFAKAVRAFQASTGFSVVDGKLGRATWAAMCKTYDFVADHEPYHIVGNRRIRATSPDLHILTWEDLGGLDLHRGGGWARSTHRTPTAILLHWGGITPRHCRDSLANAGHSSHAGISGGSVYQWLDLNHVAWHAGAVNASTIGVDICQQPVAGHREAPEGYLNLYRRDGLDVAIRKSDPTQRLTSSFGLLTLDPQTARTVRTYVKDLCLLFDIPFQSPRQPSGLVDHAPAYGVAVRDGDAKGRGVFGHHHVSAQKGDIGLWWEDIFGGTNCGNPVA